MTWKYHGIQTISVLITKELITINGGYSYQVMNGLFYSMTLEIPKVILDT